MLDACSHSFACFFVEQLCTAPFSLHRFKHIFAVFCFYILTARSSFLFLVCVRIFFAVGLFAGRYRRFTALFASLFGFHTAPAICCLSLPFRHCLHAGFAFCAWITPLLHFHQSSCADSTEPARRLFSLHCCHQLRRHLFFHSPSAGSAFSSPAPLSLATFPVRRLHCTPYFLPAAAPPWDGSTCCRYHPLRTPTDLIAIEPTANDRQPDWQP